MEKIKKDEFYDRAAMRVILQPLVEEELEEFDAYNQIPHEYSDTFMKRIGGIFRRDGVKRGFRKSFMYIRKVAVCVAALLMLTLVACAAIKPLRDRVANAFVTWYEEYAAVSYEVEEEEIKLKQPTVIPEGYVEIERYEYEGSSKLSIDYINDEGMQIFFDRYENYKGFELYVDREHTNMMEIDFNGMKAIYMEPQIEGGMYSLMWQEGNMVYCVDSDESKEKLLEFAENVK